MSTESAALSPEMEDYLEAIAALARVSGEARVTDIAEKLSVRKPSVTQALRSLADKGLLHYRPYASPTLTDTGRRIAAGIQHRHDVIKRFLTQVLLVDPDVGEKNACRLEHAMDKEVLGHLMHFMQFVQRCPRGGANWIRGYEYFCDPENETEKCERCMQMALDEYREQRAVPTAASTENRTMTLAELSTGQTARIVRVGNAGAIRKRIVDMGAVRGTRVTVAKVAPLGDPIEIKIRGYSLTLRKEEASAITVEPVEDGG